MKATKEQLAMAEVFHDAIDLLAIFAYFGGRSCYVSRSLYDACNFRIDAVKLSNSLGFNGLRNCPMRTGILWLTFVAEGLERGEIEL